MARKLIFVHPSLLAYRRDFFERIATKYTGETCVYFSPSDMGVLSADQMTPTWATPLGSIKSIAPGLQWQIGAASIPLGNDSIVVVSGAPRCLSNLVLLFRARLKGAKTVWWGHYQGATTRPFRKTLRLALARWSHALLFYTDTEVEQYKSLKLGRNNQPVHSLNNGIDTTVVNALRKAYIPEERELSMLFIGRLTKKAGLALAIQALSRPMLKKVTLEIVGDGDERSALEALAISHGVHARVRWHGASIDEAKISDVANRCRLFLYPGEVGLSLIHAMAYGLPAVLHNNPRIQMPEYSAFEHMKTGVSFKRGVIDDLERKLAGLLYDNEALAGYSSAALTRISNDYNTEAMAKRMLALVALLETTG